MTASILWNKDDYKADLTECLGGIDSSSKKLLEKATMGNFREVHKLNIKASEGEWARRQCGSGTASVDSHQQDLTSSRSCNWASSRW
jgi:hypothetical protein